jgi:DNA modification methylase
MNIYADLYLGDNLEVAENLPPEMNGAAQLLLTSTPYPGQRGFSVSPEEYLTNWLPNRIKAWIPLLNPRTGVLALNVKFKRTAAWGLSPGAAFDLRLFKVGELLQEVFSLLPVDVLIWDKLNAPPAGNHRRHDRPAWEPVFIFARGPKYTYKPWREPYSPKTLAKNATGNPRRPDLFGNMGGGHARSHPAGAAADNVIRLSSSGDQGRPRVVGGSFPRALAERMIEQYSEPGDLIFDPCGGAGTTIAEAIRLNRSGLYIDNDPEAWKTAERWARESFAEQLPPGFSLYQPPVGPGRIRYSYNVNEAAAALKEHWR